MKNIKIFILLLLLTGFVSCDLDRYPTTGVPEDEAMTNPAEAQQIVFGVYSAFKNSALHSGSLTIAPDLQSDLFYAVEGFANVYGDIYRWDIKSTNADVEGVYAGLYLVISRCNFFLDKVGAIEAAYTSDTDKETLRKCKGDIYFMRALAYSELIRLFCKAYNPATAENDLGVSLVTTYVDTGEKPLRSSLAASYRLVIDDLTKANKLVLRDVTDNPYITTGAVNALLARVYLYMHEWKLAADHATEVIKNSNYSLQSALTTTMVSGVTDYNRMWVYDAGPEIIWKISMSFTDRGAAQGPFFIGPTTLYAQKQYRPDFVPAQWVIDLYSAADVRYTSFFAEQPTVYAHGLVWPLLMKYSGNPDLEDGRPLLTNMPKVFRLSEQYLIRAEAYYHLGATNDANADLTTLRRARISGYGSSSAAGEALLKTIQEERVRELIMEGFRLSDLKRWGLGFQRKEQAHTVNGPNRLRIDKNNALFTWPIPKHEMDAVEGMQPNDSND